MNVVYKKSEGRESERRGHFIFEAVQINMAPGTRRGERGRKSG
jgi:hypothetical protein